MAGVVAVAVVLWISAVLLWVQAGFDRWVLASLTALRMNELVAGLAHTASHYGMPVIVLVYLVYLLFAFKLPRLRDAYRIYLLVILIFGVAGPAGDFLKEALDRPRPSVEYAGEIEALPTAGTPALPSGHATKSVALALPFLLFVAADDRWHKWVKTLLAASALSVCCSRVLLGAHYVSDVLAGIGMALICVPLVTLLTNKMLARMNNRILDRAVVVWAAILVGLMLFLVAS